MKKLLISGFEPFDGEVINPAWEAVSRLADEIGGYSLTKIKIPVVFKDAAASVIAAAEETAANVVLSIGQASGRSAITPELVGINLRHGSIPDNAGYQPSDEVIVNGGANAIFSPLPVRKMAAAILERGIPSAVSYSAGAYVCNDVLYTLLSHFEGTDVRVGFIHVPYCKEQGKEPSMEISDIVSALTAAIESLDK